jgi:hypothetical protein
VVTAVEVLTRLQALGIKVEVRDGRLITRRPPEVAIPPDLAEAIRAYRDELIALLAVRAGPNGPIGPVYSAITPPERRTEPGGACPHCGTGLSREDLEKFGDCPRCRQTLPGWENVPTPAGVQVIPAPDPERLAQALEKVRADLGPLDGYETGLARAVLEAAGPAEGGRPWPFDGLAPARWEALRRLQDERLRQLHSQALAAAGTALSTLQAIAGDPTAHPQARVAAAGRLLEAALRLVEAADLAGRVEALELQEKWRREGRR